MTRRQRRLLNWDDWLRLRRLLKGRSRSRVTRSRQVPAHVRGQCEKDHAELLNDFERASMIEAKVFPNNKDVTCLYAIVPERMTNIRQKY